MLRCLVFAAILWCAVGYEQEFSYRTTFKNQKLIGEWPQLPITGIKQFLWVKTSSNSGTWVRTTTSEVFLYEGSTSFAKVDLGITLPAKQDYRIGHKYGTTVVATPNNIYFLSCSSNTKCVASTTIPTSLGTVHTVAPTPTGAYIGTNDGLHFADITKKTIEKTGPMTGAVLSAEWSEEEKWLVTGGWYKMWNFRNNEWYYEWAFNLVEGPPTSFLWYSGWLYVGNDAVVNREHVKDGLWERIGAAEGLPYRGVTSLQSVGDSVWIGHSNGSVSRYMPTTKQWRLYSGDRWVAASGKGVNAMLGLSGADCPVKGLNGCVLIATETGMTVMQLKEWTLKAKAEVLHKVMMERHDRYGLAGSIALHHYGNISSWYATPSDNNGLWTSMYLVSLCLKYNVTKDPQTKKEAWLRFNALKKLNTITGVPGLMGRSYTKIGDPHRGSGTWWNSTTIPGWQWKGDTSSDEVCGHMMAYSLMYDMIAETAEEKADVKKVMIDIITYITKNDWLLLGHLGKPTHWGRWNPQYLNDDPEWFDERGLNSMQIVTWTLEGLHYSQDPSVQKLLSKGLSELMKAGYGRNILNQKVVIPNDVNHSDDELAGCTYILLFWLRRIGALDNYKDLWPIFDNSWARTFRVIDVDWEGFYNAMNVWIQFAQGNKNFSKHDQDQVLAELQRFSVSHIDWPYHNQGRIDLIENKVQCRNGGHCSLTPIPPDENGLLRWNTNPYAMNGGSGHSETDPGAYMLLYWMGRYLGLVTPTD